MVSCRPNFMVFEHKIGYLIGQYTDCSGQNVALWCNLVYNQRLCLSKHTNESITIQYDIFKDMISNCIVLLWRSNYGIRHSKCLIIVCIGNQSVQSVGPLQHTTI